MQLTDPIFNDKIKQYKFANPQQYIDNDNETATNLMMEVKDIDEDITGLVNIYDFKFVDTSIA